MMKLSVYSSQSHSIKFEASSKPANKPITYTADSNSAISPILDPHIYKPITITFTMYEYRDKKTDETHFFMKGDIRVQGHNRVFYVDDTNSDKRKVYHVRNEIKKGWENSIEKGYFVLRVNCPSKTVFDHYHSKLGSDFESKDDVRGVLIKLYGCYLGKNSWIKKHWGMQRNAGHINIDIDMVSKDIANDWFCLKSNKHTSEFASSRPLITHVVGNIVKQIINNYTGTTNKSLSDKGIKVWDIKKIFTELLTWSTHKKNDANTITENGDVSDMMVARATIDSENSSVSGEVEAAPATAVVVETAVEVAAVEVAVEVAATAAAVEVAAVEPAVEVAVEVAAVEPAVEVAVEIAAEVAAVEPAVEVAAVEVAAVVVTSEGLVEATLPNHKVGNVKMLSGLEFIPSSVDGTLSIIDKSIIVCKILQFGHGSPLKSYLESMNSVEGPEYVKGLCKVMSEFMEANQFRKRY